MSEPNYGQPEPDEPEHEPWNYDFESRPQDPNWNHTYEGYAAKTIAMRILEITEKEWDKLDLSKVRQDKRLNPHSEEYFVVYCLSDLKRLLGLK